jgi:hypothetical protein
MSRNAPKSGESLNGSEGFLDGQGRRWPVLRVVGLTEPLEVICLYFAEGDYRRPDGTSMTKAEVDAALADARRRRAQQPENATRADPTSAISVTGVE